MKYFSVILISVAALATVSCNNSSGSGSNPNNAIGTSNATQVSSGSDKGTITCMMDGKQKTFNVKQSFFEISLGIDPNGPKDGLEILDGDAKKEGFQFEFKKSGASKIKDDGTGDMNCIINYYNPQVITYTGEDVIVVVTSYNQNHLTGTFSGKLVNVYYEQNAKNYPQNIQITDGKFDLH